MKTEGSNLLFFFFFCPQSLDEKTQQIAVLTVQLEDARVEATTSARHTTHGDSSAGPQGGDTVSSK